VLQKSPIPSLMATKNVLVVDGDEAMQNLRASVLRSHGVQVHLAKSVAEAESLWVPDFFDLVLLDARQRSKEAVAFWRMIRRQHPRQRISFLVGPPTYLSASCVDEVMAGPKVSEGEVQRLRVSSVA
jgi:DNA-binding NtrC family response regulator